MKISWVGQENKVATCKHLEIKCFVDCCHPDFDDDDDGKYMAEYECLGCGEKIGRMASKQEYNEFSYVRELMNLFHLKK